MDKQRVLIIGDSTNGKAARILTEAGYLVELVSSVSEAAERVVSGAYGHVILSSSIFTGLNAASSVGLLAPDVDWHIPLVEHVAESTQVQLAYLDSNFNLVWVNSTYAETSGYTKEQLLGRNHFELFPHVENEEIFKRVRDTGKPYAAKEKPFEYPTQPERGVTYWNWTLTPIRKSGDPAGTARGFAFSLVDVTEEVRARLEIERLRENAERRAAEAEEGRRVLEALMEYVPEGITLADAPDAKIRMVSRHGQELLGGPHADLTAEEVAGKWHIYHKDGVTPMAAEDLPLIQAMRNREVVRDVELVQVNDDGKRLSLLCNAGPILSPEGEVEGGIVAWRDITERKQAEEQTAQARAEAERRAAELESFISSLADGAVLIDSQANVVFINDAGRRMLRIPHDQPLGNWLTLFQRYTLDGRPLPPDEIPMSRALRGETVRDARYKTIPVQGREIIFGVSASPVHDAQGKVIGATGVFRDQSERVDLEQRQEELYARERRISDVLQEALIPRNAYDIPGLEVAVRYRPALREAEVGGDFYDIFELGDGKVGILIGDVAGKGLAAAMLVAAARHTIRSYAYLDPSPGAVLTLTNEALSRELGETFGMLTAFFLVVDLRASTVAYASGGHEPPVIRDCEGRVEDLEASGRALGVLEGFVYTESVCELKHGDTILMFTDGITEAKSDSGTLFGKKGIAEYLSSTAEMSIDAIADGLLRAASAHAGDNLQDDTAVVAFGLGDFR